MTIGLQKFDSNVTGNNPTKSARCRGGQKKTIVLELSVGATPTAAFAIQGSLDSAFAAANLKTVVFIEEDGTTTDTKAITVTKTAAGMYYLVIYDRGGWSFPYLRVNMTANTNVTIVNAYLLENDFVKPIDWAITGPDQSAA